MPDILLLTGTGGVGKSTTAWTWANARQGCVIECDVLRYWIRDQPFRRRENYREDLLRDMVRDLGARNLDLGKDLVVDSVWLPTNLAALHDFFADRGRVRAVWLRCEARENLRRDGQRSSSSVLGERVHEVREELESHEWPEWLHRLDTSDLDIDGAVAAVEELFDRDE